MGPPLEIGGWGVAQAATWNVWDPGPWWATAAEKLRFSFQSAFGESEYRSKRPSNGRHTVAA